MRRSNVFNTWIKGFSVRRICTFFFIDCTRSEVSKRKKFCPSNGFELWSTPGRPEGGQDEAQATRGFKEFMYRQCRKLRLLHRGVAVLEVVGYTIICLMACRTLGKWSSSNFVFPFLSFRAVIVGHYYCIDIENQFSIIALRLSLFIDPFVNCN